jgi:hypothetical protein
MDADAIALIGPFRSRDVAETVEATAPAGLALLAPTATWAGVTRDDEPGCDDDPADHRGTVFRLLARDTVVAGAIAEDVRRTDRLALVVAGGHEYGTQLDGQLHVAELPRATDPEQADLLVLCGLPGEPEIAEARALGSLPVVAFDGAQGEDLGPDRDVLFALPFAPDPGLSAEELLAGVGQVRRAAHLVAWMHGDGARDRRSLLARLQALAAFDDHGDPTEPVVWLWRFETGASATPERALLGA